MASGRTRTNTAIQTRSVLPEARLLLSPARNLVVENEEYCSCSSPLFSVPQIHNKVSTKELAPANTHVVHVGQLSCTTPTSTHAGTHVEKEGIEKNEPHVMSQPPARSWQGSTAAQETPEDQRSGSHAFSTPGSPLLGRRPSQQDSSYYSVRELDDGSEIDVEVQARQIRARERVVILRKRVLRTRRLKRERKGKLRQLRDLAADALSNLTRTLNELVAIGRLDSLQAELSPLYDELRRAQDELGPAESAFDQLENRLDEEEQDLEEEEDYFYRHNDVLSLDVAEAKLDEQLSPLVKPYHPPEIEFREFSLQDQKVQEYLAMVEDAERLKDGLDDLENDYYRLANETNFRRRHGVAISADTLDFIKNYPDEYKEMLDRLHIAEDTLMDLRDECIDNGIFQEGDYVYEPRDALCEDVMDSVEEARERSPLRVAADRCHEEEINFGDKRDYVNKWLLEWVPDSTLDTMMLQSWIYHTFPDTAHKTEDLGDDKWTELAIENWDKDSAGKRANIFYNASKRDAITGDVTGDAGNLGPLSTTRSGFYGSALSMDVVLDDERPSQDILTSNTSSTRERTVDLTPANQDYTNPARTSIDTTPTKQSYANPASTDTTPKQLQAKHPTLFVPYPVTKKSTSLSDFPGTDSPNAHTFELLVSPARRSRSVIPSDRRRDSQSSQVQPHVPVSETDISTMRENDASSTAAGLRTPNGIAHPNTLTSLDEDHDSGKSPFSQGNASILSDLVIPLNDVSI